MYCRQIRKYVCGSDEFQFKIHCPETIKTNHSHNDLPGAQHTHAQLGTWPGRTAGVVLN